MRLESGDCISIKRYGATLKLYISPSRFHPRLCTHSNSYRYLCLFASHVFITSRFLRNMYCMNITHYQLTPIAHRKQSRQSSLSPAARITSKSTRQGWPFFALLMSNAGNCVHQLWQQHWRLSWMTAAVASDLLSQVPQCHLPSTPIV